MYKLTLLFSVLIAFNASAMIEKIPDNSLKTLEELELENIIFENTNDLTPKTYDINSFELIEIEEDVELNFDTKAYLPVNFNALQGMHNLDWNTIELVELEEDVEINFDTKAYLPSDFSAYNIDWSTVNLVELEEDVELNFNTKAYLPKEFNPYKGMDCEKGEVVCLY